MLTATVCVALSGAGLAAALVTAWRRRFVAATRLAAVALLPVGLYLAGLITLGARIGGAIGSWGTGLVLNPMVWAGFAVLAVAVVLYLAARLAAGRTGRRSVAERGGNRAVAPGSPTPAIGRAAGTAQPRRGQSAGNDDLADFKDIEEILRKRGI